MGEFAVGQAVPRTEDPRLLKGHGRYLDDMTPAGVAHGFVLRSPHAHASIRSIDTRAAKQAPGVLAVLTGEDYAAEGFGSLPCTVYFDRPDGSPMYVPPHPALANDSVKRVGDEVAFVVAETVNQAKDAAERVIVDYDPLPSVSTIQAAAASGAPPVWEDCPDNVCFGLGQGDAEAVDTAFARADHVVSQRFVVNRVSANTMEPRNCIGHYDAATDRYTLHTGLQNPHQVRGQLARDIFGLPETAFRVVSGDIGGSFGMRGGTYPELVLVLWASKLIGRPIKWVCERSEGLASDDHARDNVSEVALALDSDGRFLGLKVATRANVGAYLAVRGARPPTGNLGTLCGVYTTPAARVDVTGMFTNTNSFNPYRGSGGPEAGFVTERLIDIAARTLGIDRAEIRRRNLVSETAMPYTNPLGYTYDCGNFASVMTRALDRADYDGFEARRNESRNCGMLRGIGIANAIKKTSIPVMETATVRFNPTGGVTLLTGTVDHGQGHQTIFKQLMCERMGLAPEEIRIVEGDTDLAMFGGGTFGSRSAALGGSAIVGACDKIIDKGRVIAAHLLEAAETDVAFADGVFAVAGTDRSVSLAEVAAAAHKPQRLPPEVEPGLEATSAFCPEQQNWPYCSHVCEVEVDPDTGMVEILRYTSVGDEGTVLNPLLLEAQVHGGVVQSLGQALLENVVFDEDTGQLLSGSFMDYCMPRADDYCFFDHQSAPIPTATNPLGVKGAGEVYSVAALPAVANAVMDALAEIGVGHVDPPLTPERVWQAIRDAGSMAEGATVD